MTFSPDSSHFLTECGNRVHISSTSTGKDFTPPLNHPRGVTSACYSPDARWVVSSCWFVFLQELEARLWDASNGKLLAILKHRNGIAEVTFSPDSKWVATASEDLTARVWQVPTGLPASPCLQHFTQVRHLAFSPDSRWLAAGCYNGGIRIWDWAAGEALTPPIKLSSPVEHLVHFLPSGECLFAQPLYREDGFRTDPGVLIKLPARQGTLQDWFNLASLLSAHQLDANGVLVPLSPEVLRLSFTTLRTNLPEFFVSTH